MVKLKCSKCSERDHIAHYSMCLKCYIKWKKEEFPKCVIAYNAANKRMEDKWKLEEEWRNFWDD